MRSLTRSLLFLLVLGAVIEADGVCASAGSACHSHSSDASAVKISHVLATMHVPREFALGTLRLSVGRHTTHDELIAAAAAIHRAIEHVAQQRV